MQLPGPVVALAARLATLGGVKAVALGGSRATGAARSDSDWDVGVYYRGRFDPGEVRALGHGGYVSAVGEGARSSTAVRG
jgi:predicted nucleotidyltransferase